VVALNVEPVGGPAERIELHDPYVVICGYTGRDPQQVAAHIEELQELGVEPPASVPVFIPVPGSLLRQPNGTAEVASRDTSGEAEPVLIRIAGRADVFAVGSDHTDRALETESLAAGKAACPKFVSTTAWPFDDVRDRWDSLELSATVNGSAEPVLQGTLDALTHPDELLTLLEASLALPDDRPAVLFLGTLAGGHSEAGREPIHNFTAHLHDPHTERRLVCAYDIREPAEGVAQ
jgi:Protein of unknown function (DUF2848)